MTPTLCDTIPSFEAMIQKWIEKQEEDPETHTIIEQGLNKLDAYCEQVNLVPAYVVAMSKFSQFGPLQYLYL